MYIPHPRHPLRPCCKHGGASGTREGPLPILVLLSPRPKRLERSILRRGRCTARCTQGRVHGDHGTPPRAGGVAGARDHICGIGARGKKGHVVDVRPFPERVLDGIVDTARANTKKSCEHKPLIGKSWGKRERRTSICASPVPPFPRMYSRSSHDRRNRNGA